MSVLDKILRVGSGKSLKELEVVASRVTDLEPSVKPLSDDQLVAKTTEFRERLANGAPLADIETEAFAVVREAAWRVLGQRPYDVQVVGAAALARGMIAEMKTGEGKTLVSTMPAYLNALSGDGIHIVTVNDYLARRDAEWMGRLHRFLGLSVGLIQNDMTPEERRPAYEADITYGTNNEFGFDYLRDNMALESASMVQRGHHYAIVDEVDSILVDEARTPLIISGRVADTAKWYREFSRLVERLREGDDYEIDERRRQVMTTETGVSKVEQLLGVENMYDHAAVDFVHHLDAALRAKTLFEKDVDYLLDNGEVKIVDEFTGRVLDGRRYSEGLHQAIEAKEGVAIKEENQTLATITLQNYFRMYDKLSGMTGTAETEEAEFQQIYGLEVVVVPTNRPIARLDQADLVYRSEPAKFNAVVEDIAERHERGQPVLVGTVSIEKSERLSALLTRRGVKHEVLNAKQHAREAQIVAQAGRLGAVTVATNMAGRGVDIRLGGDPESMAENAMVRYELDPASDEYQVKYADQLETFKLETEAQAEQVIGAGGLYVLGTGRHDSRRIDNQLRGRSGRQGDPGESRFYLSLEDDLMRRFARDRVAAIIERLNMPEDMPIEAKIVSKAIERAQGQVEQQNFEIRKNVLKYDEVMNKQREVIYAWRSGILEEGRAGELVSDWIEEAVDATVRSVLLPDIPPQEWEWDDLLTQLTVLYPHELTKESFDLIDAGGDVDAISAAAVEDARATYEAREDEIGAEKLRALEQRVVLTVIDNKWREHLAEMDYLRSGIGLRAMGQKDPLVEYQREGYDMFSGLVESVKQDAVRYLFHVQVVQEPAKPVIKPIGQFTTNKGGQAAPARKSPVKVDEKVGRNEACPCGSGKKYKRCHGAA
ncbi:MAG: preprotein translocase subunit SecA [Acidimicrobiia bacterium]|nr:preprotein translocase subunit SecA [Acidimicrobiia bacterium]NNL27787.1 preprotein translocase subunit SecA [Acidimicrobiia bacterium]NNL47606.1 preprotein translocase subunit SecA [Acidimicrobiia bacterium]